MSETLKPCAECGMPVEPGEYHPYAACLMFKQTHNSATVRANLWSVQDDISNRWRSVAEQLEKFARTQKDFGPFKPVGEKHMIEGLAAFDSLRKEESND